LRCGARRPRGRRWSADGLRRRPGTGCARSRPPSAVHRAP
jgi:hypothetical protein